MLKHILLVIIMTIPVLGMVPAKTSVLRFLYVLPVYQDDSTNHWDDGYLTRCGQPHVHKNGQLIRVIQRTEYQLGYAYVVLESTRPYDTTLSSHPIIGMAEITYPRCCSEDPTMILIRFDPAAITEAGSYGAIDTSKVSLIQLNQIYWGLAIQSDGYSRIYKCCDNWPVVWSHFSSTEDIITAPDGDWYMIRTILRNSSGILVCRTYKYDGLSHYVPTSQRVL